MSGCRSLNLIITFVPLRISSTSATILSHCLLHVPVVVLATQALSDVLPAGDVVPEGYGEQFVAPGDVE